MATLFELGNLAGTFTLVLRLAMERQAMMTARNMSSLLRRDANYVGNAVGAVICVGFASLAVAAAVLDLVAVTH